MRAIIIIVFVRLTFKINKSFIHINAMHSGIKIKTIDANNEASACSRVVKLVPNIIP
jgi:hypothetical protein